MLRRAWNGAAVHRMARLRWRARRRTVPPGSCSRTCSSRTKLPRTPKSRTLKGAVVAIMAGARPAAPENPAILSRLSGMPGGNQEIGTPPCSAGVVMTRKRKAERFVGQARAGERKRLEFNRRFRFNFRIAMRETRRRHRYRRGFAETSL